MVSLALINLSSFKAKIAENITYLIDAATQEIADDPVFVSYVESGGVRLSLRSSIEHFLAQIKKSRALVNAAQADNSGIQLALQGAENLSELEEAYKRLLQKMIDEGLNGEAITQLCLLFDVISVRLIPLFLFNPSIARVVFTVSEPALDPYSNDYEEILELQVQMSAEIPIGGLHGFFMMMYLQQTSIVSENSSALLQDDGSPLAAGQIVCPYTKKTINAITSLQSRTQATNFLALCIALAQLAKVNDSSIDEFLKTQSPSYINQANEQLLNYLKAPQKFGFTVEQHKFLQDMGTKAASSQLKYAHLWQDSRTLEANVLSLLRDYSKQDWISPTLGLFLTGHWRRHHHAVVIDAIKAIKRGELVADVLLTLENEAKENSDFNPEGSLMRRLEYIRDQGKAGLLLDSTSIEEQGCKVATLG